MTDQQPAVTVDDPSIPARTGRTHVGVDADAGDAVRPSIPVRTGGTSPSTLTAHPASVDSRMYRLDVGRGREVRPPDRRFPGVRAGLRSPLGSDVAEPSIPGCTGRTRRTDSSSAASAVDSRTYGPDRASPIRLLHVSRRFPRVRDVPVVVPVVAARVPSIPASTGLTAGWGFAGNTSAVDSHAYGTDRRLTVISLSVSRRFPFVRPDKTTRDSDCRRIRRFLCVRACPHNLPYNLLYNRRFPRVRAGRHRGPASRPADPSIPARTGRTLSPREARPFWSVDSRG